MLKSFSILIAFTFLTIVTFGISCNGQVKKELPKENQSDSKTLAVGPPKLIKNLGSLKDKGNNVQCSLQDKAGNLWFGTTGDGVYKYDGKSFTQYTASNGLNHNSVLHMLEDKDGKIWIGTVASLVLYDGQTFTEMHIPLPKNRPSNPYANTPNVFSIMQDRSGKLWFATIEGVYFYDGTSFTAFVVDDADAGYKNGNNNVEHILEDKAGNIWFGGRGKKGVFRYDGKSITQLKPNGDNWAWPVLQDKKGNIWFSNWNGAYRFDGKSFTSFTKKDGLSSDIVTRIMEDKKGNLWFGGLNESEGPNDLGFGSTGGISRYDGKTFTIYTTKDGLLNNDIWSILEDKTGNIWIGTRGTLLHRFDGKTFTSYTEKEEQAESLPEDKWTPFRRQ